MILRFIGENFSIAKLLPGKDYLDPELALIIDDTVEVDEKKKTFELFGKMVK